MKEQRDETFAWEVTVGIALAVFFALIVWLDTPLKIAIAASIFVFFVEMVVVYTLRGEQDNPTIPVVFVVFLGISCILAHYYAVQQSPHEKNYYYTPPETYVEEGNTTLPSCIIEYYPMGCADDTLRIYIINTGTNPLDYVNITNDTILVYQENLSLPPLNETIIGIRGCPSLVENASRIWYCCGEECHYWNYSSRGWPPS